MSRADRRKYYNSSKWRSVRKQQLLNYPNCANCGKPAKVCDHINPHTTGWEKRFYSGPFQSLCFSCHSSKTNLIDGNATDANQRRRYSGFFGGLPLSGGGAGQRDGSIDTPEPRGNFIFHATPKPLPKDSAQFLANKLLTREKKDK